MKTKQYKAKENNISEDKSEENDTEKIIIYIAGAIKKRRCI